MDAVRLLLFISISICLVIAGTFLLLFLPYALHAPHYIEDWVVVSQVLAVICVLTTLLASLARAPWAFPVALTTLVLTYFVVAVSLATGSWAWIAVMNAGSAYPALAFGDCVIGQGDLPPVHIDPVLWLLETMILTAVAALAARAIVRHLGRGQDRGANQAEEDRV